MCVCVCVCACVRVRMLGLCSLLSGHGCCIDECVYSLLGFIFTLFFSHIVPGSTRVLEYTGFHHLRPNHYTIIIL